MKKGFTTLCLSVAVAAIKLQTPIDQSQQLAQVESKGILGTIGDFFSGLSGSGKKEVLSPGGPHIEEKDSAVSAYWVPEQADENAHPASVTYNPDNRHSVEPFFPTGAFEEEEVIADKVSIDDQNFELKATNHEGSLDTDDPSDLLNGVVSGGTDETTLTDYPLDIDLQSATSDSRDYTDSFDIVVPIMSVSQSLEIGDPEATFIEGSEPSFFLGSNQEETTIKNDEPAIEEIFVEEVQEEIVQEETFIPDELEEEDLNTFTAPDEPEEDESKEPEPISEQNVITEEIVEDVVEELTHDIELDEATVIPSDVDDEVKDEIPIDDLQNWNELDFEIIAYDPIAEFEEPIVDDAYDPIAVLEEPSSQRSARSLQRDDNKDGSKKANGLPAFLSHNMEQDLVEYLAERGLEQDDDVIAWYGKDQLAEIDQEMLEVLPFKEEYVHRLMRMQTDGQIKLDEVTVRETYEPISFVAVEDCEEPTCLIEMGLTVEIEGRNGIMVPPCLSDQDLDCAQSPVL